MAAVEPPRRDIITTRALVALLVLAFICLAFYALQPILLPFVLGGVIAYLADPIVDYLESHKVNRTLAVVLVFTVISAVITLCLLVLIPMLAQQMDTLIRKIPLAYQWLTSVLMPWLQETLNIPASVLPHVDWSDQLADNWQSLGKMVAQTGKKITGSGAALMLGLANLALVPVVAFYLMRDWDLLISKALRMMPLAWQDQVTELVVEADEVVGSFMRGQFFVMCSLGLIYWLGLWLVGLELAMLLGLMAGLASVVPYLGFLVGIVSSFVAAYAQFGEWGVLIWVALVFGVGQALESMVLTPILVGDRIGLHPVAVIFALMVGGQLAGFVGVLVALPVAAVIMVFVRHAVSHYRSSELYAKPHDEP